MLYENVERLCKEKGITITKLEKDCGFGNATVRSWKDMHDTPRFTSMKKVADYFGVSIDMLMAEGDEDID